MSKCYALLALILLSVSATAGTIPAGWTCNGNCGISTSADGVVPLSPTGNDHYEWISTNGGVAGVGALPNIPQHPTGPGETDGTVLKTAVFSANAGDPLSFYFNFVTSDGGTYNDYAWVQLYDSNDVLTALLFSARSNPSGNAIPGFEMPLPIATLSPSPVTIVAGAPVWSPLGEWSNTCWDAGCGYTGWVQTQYDIPSTGSYYLAFGATNWDDQFYDSGLAIDGIAVNNNPIPDDKVPEPGSLVLLGTGLLGIAGIVRRKLRV